MERLEEIGCDCKYTIIREYVRSKKKELNHKATVRFETMPGLQSQVDNIIDFAFMPRKLHIVGAEKMRDGAGSVTVTHLVEASEMPSKCKLCAILTVEPSCSIGLHTHNPDAEIFYMLEGTLHMTDCGKEVVLNEGDTMYTGPGESHSVTNNSDKTAKLFAVVID